MFAGHPPAGFYLVRVDMFDACHEPAANYLRPSTPTALSASPAPAGSIDLDADGGGPGAGLFVVELAL